MVNNMTSTTDPTMVNSGVEEVFTIESGNGLIDLTILHVSLRDDSGVSVQIVSTTGDTSFLIFAEGLTPERRIGLVKIGPDSYYALNKQTSIIYKLPASRYVFPAVTSVDLSMSSSLPEDTYLLITLRTDSPVLKKQFEDVLNFFATLVEETPGAVPEIDAITEKVGLRGLPVGTLYPRLPTALTEPMQVEDVQITPTPSTLRERQRPVRLPSPSAPAKQIGKGIVSGSEFVALGFNYGTNFAEKLVQQGGSHLIQNQMYYTPKSVDPRVISTLKTLRFGAEKCSTVAESAVEHLANGARCLSQKLVPHIQTHGTHLVSKATGKDTETAGRYVTDALAITASGIQGFATVTQAFSTNAKRLCKAVAGETVKYVQRRYGDEVAEATNEALYATGNVVVAATAVKDLAPKALVKKAAKEAGKEAVRAAAGQ